jgi:DNA primase
MKTLALPRNLPAAKLPDGYESAKAALARCFAIDECKEWADKAQALASYAKQAKDDSLRKDADRIQARAVRRCGELLKQIKPAKNQHDVKQRARAGAGPSRKRAAQKAGLSERQQKTALRVADVPTEEFERAVESEDPPTVRSSRPSSQCGSTPPRCAARAHAWQTWLPVWK